MTAVCIVGTTLSVAYLFGACVTDPRGRHVRFALAAVVPFLAWANLIFFRWISG